MVGVEQNGMLWIHHVASQWPVISAAHPNKHTPIIIFERGSTFEQNFFKKCFSKIVVIRVKWIKEAAGWHACAFRNVLDKSTNLGYLGEAYRIPWTFMPFFFFFFASSCFKKSVVMKHIWGTWIISVKKLSCGLICNTSFSGFLVFLSIVISLLITCLFQANFFAASFWASYIWWPSWTKGPTVLYFESSFNCMPSMKALPIWFFAEQMCLISISELERANKMSLYELMHVFWEEDLVYLLFG